MDGLYPKRISCLEIGSHSQARSCRDVAWGRPSHSQAVRSACVCVCVCMTHIHKPHACSLSPCPLRWDSLPPWQRDFKVNELARTAVGLGRGCALGHLHTRHLVRFCLDCLFTRKHTRTRIHTHTRTHAHTLTHTRTRIHTHTQTHAHTLTDTQTHRQTGAQVSDSAGVGVFFACRRARESQLNVLQTSAFFSLVTDLVNNIKGIGCLAGVLRREEGEHLSVACVSHAAL